ncbi:MAG TPA: hypothetical protein DG754_01915 [Bacteroidales bacterium]|jgi:hypothetical protein|nr:hypothetical protein [Bacteroidales bacterium]
MKNTKLFLISTLVAIAFLLGSCGTTTEKNKAENANVECSDELKAGHDCEHAKVDTCKTEEGAAHDCDHDHEEAQE